MANFVIGDSICVGIGDTCTNDVPAGNVFATGGMPISRMGPHFDRAYAAANRGDTVFVSAGYNGGISASDRQILVNNIRRLEGKGVNVVFLGLREQWSAADTAAATAAGDHGRAMEATTPALNRQLREIAQETGAVFAESTIAVANSIPGGRIHGKSSQILAAAMRDAGSSSGSSTTAPGAPSDADREANNADANRNNAQGSTETWAQMAERMKREGGINGIIGYIISFFVSLFDGSLLSGLGDSLGGLFGGGSTRTPAQEIGDVTTMLGVRGQSGALQDNTLSDTEKNSLKIEIQQVKAAIARGTMTDELRQSVNGMLGTLREGGVQDTDTILGPSITELRTAIQPAAPARNQ